MSGKIGMPKESLEEPSPSITTSRPSHTTMMSHPPPREMPRRGSSAKDLISKFEEARRQGSSSPHAQGSAKQHDVSFTTIDSFGAGGRGLGLEEHHSSKNNTQNNSPEEKKKRAFIPSSLVSTKKQVVEERVSSSSRAASGTAMTDFEERVRAKSNALKPAPRSDNAIATNKAGSSRPGAGGISSSESKSGVSMDDFQQRILKKSFSTDGNDSARSAAAGNSFEHILEQRIMEKTKSNNDTTVVGPSSSRSSTSPSSRLEQRIMEKTKSNNAAVATSSLSNSQSNRLLEQRIMEKSKSNSNAAAVTSSSASNSRGGGIPPSDSTSSVSMNDFQQRILKKSVSTDSNDSSSKSVTGNPSYEHLLEQRILEKTKKSNNATATSSSMGNSQSQSQSGRFEQRILEKTKSNNKSKNDTIASSSIGNHNSPSSSRDFEQRVLENARSSATIGSSGGTNKSTPGEHFDDRLRGKLAASLNESNNSNEYDDRPLSSSMASFTSGGDASFEARLLDKAISSRSTAGMGSPATSSTGGQVGGGAEGAGSSKKRRAIQQLMQDKSLDPQERNRRLTSIMSGNWTTSSESESDPDGSRNHSSSRPNFRMVALEAKIANKLKKRVEDSREEQRQQQHDLDDSHGGEEIVRGGGVRANRRPSDDDDSDSEDYNRESSKSLVVSEGGIRESPSPHYRPNGVVGFGSLPLPDEHFAPEESGSSSSSSRGNNNNIRRESPPPPRPGIGFGSLPLPHEHFAPATGHRSPPLEERARPSQAAPPQAAAARSPHSHPGAAQDDIGDDADFGLAVATAVAPDDEPDYVYNAIEFDPEAKPPLHRNRRFRVYTYFALGMIAIVVVLVVVYITSASKGTNTQIQKIDFQNSPTLLPTTSPTTNREASGIIEQLEGGILYTRNETFADMERNDPRLLALDWILHKDDMLLVSDDVNLYQRFALAVLAYSMDAGAWYYCGDHGGNFTESECSIFFRAVNATKTFGVWLSSTSECTWYGVTCSEDGVVRGVDLKNNNLIGVMPHELAALEFLQLLSLSHNCIFGTIPPELGSMRHLLSLELHGNGLSGELPREIYSLEKLQLLNLAEQWGGDRECDKTDGSVVDINYRMGGSVRPLEVNGGLMGTLGKEIGVWRSMKGLYLNKNSFEGHISEEIGSLRYLRWLWLNDNLIEGSLPSTITKLRNLRDLRLGDNFLISSLPSDLGRMTDLEILTVNGNSMFGEIPNGLYKLKKLDTLRLDDTLMGEAPWLVVPDEGFTGSISTLIGGLQDLRWLFLSNNPMTGTM